uniref:Uncharacterized protein n=1 Tax=Takifugu rubripes TaxID=31033 RepID=A0A674NNV0_TAKRU
MHRLDLEHEKAGLPGHVEEDLSHLHQKIERLEHLLGDNNRLVIRLHDTLDQQKKLLKGGEKANQSLVEAPPGCQLTKGVNNGTDGVQMLDLYNILPFDNPDGGAWKQGFEILYEGNEWDKHPLELILAGLKTFDKYFLDQTTRLVDKIIVVRRKMIWAEISFFSKWWNDIDEQKRDLVKRRGSWCEAAYRLGRGSVRSLPSMTYLLKGAGLQNMVIQRVHYAVRSTLEIAVTEVLSLFLSSRLGSFWDSV